MNFKYSSTSHNTFLQDFLTLYLVHVDDVMRVSDGAMRGGVADCIGAPLQLSISSLNLG